MPSRFGTGSSKAIKSLYLLSGLIKCSHCGSERLDEIGDEVLECVNCKAVKALS